MCGVDFLCRVSRRISIFPLVSLVNSCLSVLIILYKRALNLLFMSPIFCSPLVARLNSLTIDPSDDDVRAMGITSSVDDFLGLFDMFVPKVDSVVSFATGIDGIGAFSVSFGSVDRYVFNRRPLRETLN